MKCKTKRIPRLLPYVLAVLLLILLVCSIAFYRHSVLERQQKEAEVLTISTLQKVINTSELSTYTAVYNGIAQVMDDKDPEKTDYYVSYEATVDAGLDFEQVTVYLDPDSQTIRISLPEIYITDVNVDVSSLDFIFYDDKANVSAVSQQALKACETDVTAESEKQKIIFELAEQNAKNVITALASPIIEQSDVEYTLLVE